ncbi:MAG: sigma-70 family RNA polymerase sigma factor [Chitinophagaceae bacterium]
MKTGQFNHISDAQLLHYHSEDNNSEWIGILLERYTLLLFGVCMKYMKEEQEAKDCVQQIFLKVLTDVSKYKIDYFKSWLYMVAKNHCLMKLRGQKGKVIIEMKETASYVFDEEEKEWEESEKMYLLLEKSIEELGEEQQRCVQLFYLQKNSYQQVSDKTGFSLLQVKSFIQNGKRNLKLIMEKKNHQLRTSHK